MVEIAVVRSYFAIIRKGAGTQILITTGVLYKSLLALVASHLIIIKIYSKCRSRGLLLSGSNVGTYYPEGRWFDSGHQITGVVHKKRASTPVALLCLE